MIKHDIIRFSKRIKILNKLDEQDVAVFNQEPFFAIPAVSELLKIPEKDIILKIRQHDGICVDLEFVESESIHVVHDGASATGRPLVLGVTWRGLQMICAEFDSDLVRLMAKDIITVDYMSSNPRTLAHYYSKKGGKGKTTMM